MTDATADTPRQPTIPGTRRPTIPGTGGADARDPGTGEDSVRKPTDIRSGAGGASVSRSGRHESGDGDVGATASLDSLGSIGSIGSLVSADSLASADSLVVAEVFGPTWQGEGPSLGTRAGFVRLGRCNLACTWCDTPYTWDWERYDPAVELTRRTVDDIASTVEAMRVPLVVVTGGEPLLQQSHLPPLLARLKASGHRIEIETAATIAPSEEVVALVDRFNVSPKLANSGNAFDRRLKPAVLRTFVASGKAGFKFVASTPADLDEIADMVATCDLPSDTVWVMPEGTDPTTVVERAKALAEGVLARGWNMTTRLHVLLWGDERGR